MKKMCMMMLVALSLVARAQEIKFNQLGFYARGQKIAVVPATTDTTFLLVNATNMEIAHKGKLTAPKTWSSSGENICVADFSSFTQTGVFFIKSGGRISKPFPIKNKDVYKGVTTWSIKAFYQWRASTPIDSAHAYFDGFNFARKAGHMDNKVLIHSSAATANRPAGTIVSAPKGWYDAGDYNLYPVNAGGPVWSLLNLYETHKSYFDTLNLNIPESNNNLPDLLDEVKWELDWLLSMMDTNDGGIYHKLTSLAFSGMVMPDQDKSERYMVGKSTAATLDFAAMTAKASRSFRTFDPAFADSLLKMAKKAYGWAELNPWKYFNANPTGVSTGVYGDNQTSDEFFWARAELYLATGDITYFNKLGLASQTFDVPGWSRVQSYGLFSLMTCIDSLSDENKKLVREKFKTISASIIRTTEISPYRVGIDRYDWGSNGYTALQGTVMIIAYNDTKDVRYLNAANSILDYILGRNGVGYCFVTGFGTRSPLFIHDRRAESDGIYAPMPGYLAGGPNSSSKGDCGSGTYTSSYPAKQYADATCSYTTNEIAINWNGSFAYLAGSIDASLNNFSIEPTLAKTDESGKTISILFDHSFVPSHINPNAFSLTSESIQHSIDSAKTFNNSIIVFLNDELSPSAANISISYRGQALSTFNNQRTDTIFTISVFNDMTDAAPYISSARTNAAGDSVFITFNKLIQATGGITGLEIICEGNNIIKSASIAGNQVEANISIVAAEKKLVVMSSSSNIQSTNGVPARPVSSYPVVNISKPGLPSVSEASTAEDGFLVFLTFNKPIKTISGPSKITTISHGRNKQQTPLKLTKLPNVNGLSATLTYDAKFEDGDSLVISYEPSNLVSSHDEPLPAFSCYALVKLPNGKIINSVGASSPTLIEAEKYAYNQGMRPEECADSNGGFNLTDIDKLEWVEYIIDVKDSGSYKVDVRCASKIKASKLSITTNKGGAYVIINTPHTYDWQTWQTESGLLTLDKGVQTIKLRAENDQFNLNWLKFTKVADQTSATCLDNKSFDVYPNPSTSGTFNIIFDDKNEQKMVKVLDNTGKIILQETTNSIPYQINIKTKGAYTLQVSDSKSTNTTQLIVE